MKLTKEQIIEILQSYAYVGDNNWTKQIDEDQFEEIAKKLINTNHYQL